MKEYIYSQSELDKISIENRYKKYIYDDLVATAKGKDDNTPLVEIHQKDIEFLIEPFWTDPPMETDDKELQELLEMEGRAFRKYMQKNPDFKMQVRGAVIDKLSQVQNILPKNIKLVLKAGYRPISVQKSLFAESLSNFKKRYPNKTDKELYEMNLEFVADPDKYIAPHSTGGAVDINLFDTSSNKNIDMGCPINYPDDRSWTFYSKLTIDQIENRKFLNEIMLKMGFANLPSEWWHYSYGDQYWAKFYNKEYFYGAISI